MQASPRKSELSLGVLRLLARLWAAVSRKAQTAAAATDAFQCSEGALRSVGAGDFVPKCSAEVQCQRVPKCSARESRAKPC
jgi:hypothetical protein